MNIKWFSPLCLAAGLAAASLFPLQARAALPEITVLTIIDVTPDYDVEGNVEHETKLLKALAEDGRQMPGNVSFQVLGDPSRANHFIVLSVWKDMQSFNAYSGAPATKAFRQAFQPGMDGPFDERIYENLK